MVKCVTVVTEDYATNLKIAGQKPKTINYVDWFNSMVKTNGNHLLHISPVPIVSILDRNHKQLKDHYH